MFAIDALPAAYFFNYSTLKKDGDRIIYRIRAATVKEPKAAPDGSAVYREDQAIIDCVQSLWASIEVTYFDKSDAIVSHFKLTEASKLDPSAMQKIDPNSIAATGKKILCDDNLRGPLFTASELNEAKLTYISPMEGGISDIFYGPVKIIIVPVSSVKLH